MLYLLATTYKKLKSATDNDVYTITTNGIKTEINGRVEFYKWEEFETFTTQFSTINPSFILIMKEKEFINIGKRLLIPSTEQDDKLAKILRDHISV
jgi:hypothetical protein